MKTNTVLTVIIAAALACTSAFAATQKVEFFAGQANGTFNCIASDPTAKIRIDTNSIKVSGFCNGHDYVTRNGHIANFPALSLNTQYFQIEKRIGKAGSVTIESNRGGLTCSEGQGNKLASFGDGVYC